MIKKQYRFDGSLDYYAYNFSFSSIINMKQVST